MLFDDLYKGSSAAEQGTLCQLKIIFDRRNVKKDVKSSTHASRELIHFVKYGYTVIAAMKSLQLQNKDEAPSDMDQSMNDNQKSAYLDELVNKIITQFVLSDAENPQFILINMKSKKAYLIPVQDAKEKNTNEDSQDAHKNSHQMVL